MGRTRTGRDTPSPRLPGQPGRMRRTGPMRRAPAASLCMLLALAVSDAAGGTAAQQRWEVSLTPYAWLMDVEGTVAALPGQPPVDISVSWQDVLEDVDAGGMMLMSARRADWVVRGDVLFARTSSGDARGTGFIRAIDVDNDFGFAGLSIGHVVDEGPDHVLELNAGFRAWWFETDVVIGTVLPTPTRLSGKANWVDPMIGVVGRYRLSESWTLSGSADLGGFGVGADIATGFMVTAEYRLRDWVSLGIGWRHVYVDYDDELEYDVNHTGPIFGARFGF